MSKERSIENIRVASPCSQSWDEMSGNDRVRFCSHCSKHVNDISAMGRKEAERLVRLSKGNICVRYVTDPATGGPVVMPPKPVKIGRAPAIAAGVLGTTLSVSSLAYSQGSPRIVELPTAVERSASLEEMPEQIEPTGTARLWGVLTDPAGALVPGKEVLIRSREGGKTLSATSNDVGVFEFKDIAGGVYMLRVPESYGFHEVSRDDIRVLEGGDAYEVIELPFGETFVTVGVIAYASEISLMGPLSRAVENGDTEHVMELLAANEDVNLKEEDGRTPIFFAVWNGDIEIVKALLVHGADVNVRSEMGETPLMQLNDNSTAEMVQLLIDAGAKVNRTSSEGKTALMTAAASAPAEVVKVLLDAGAEVNARDEEGWTPLMRAAYADDFEKVQMLLFAGADVNARNNDGENAWDQTVEEAVEDLLVSFGSEVTQEFDDGTSH